MFLQWAGRLGAETEVVPVQLPGRETRMREEPYASLDELVGPCLGALAPFLDLPFCVYGHSMGSLIAYEFTRELVRRGLPQPRRLLASGRKAPHVTDDFPKLSYLSDPELLAGLEERYGAHFPDSMRELVELMLPTIRADVRLVDTYAHRPEPALAVPVSVFSGRDDASVPEDSARRWSELTRGPFDIQFFDGGHFFTTTAQDRFLEALRGALAEAGGAS